MSFRSLTELYPAGRRYSVERGWQWPVDLPFCQGHEYDSTEHWETTFVQGVNGMEKEGTDSNSTSPPEKKGRSWIKIVTVLAVVIALFVLIGRFATEPLQKFKTWVEGLGPLGPAVFIASYVVMTVMLVPMSLVTLAGGAVFGLFYGVLYVITGASVGAAGAFLISRYLARSAVEKRVAGDQRFAAIDRAIGKQGLKIVVLLRLSPVFPFNLLNYFLGLSKVRFLHFNIASLAMLPGTFLYVYYGTIFGLTFQTEERQKETAEYIAQAVGLLVTIIVTVYITRVARKALKETTEETIGATPAASL